MTFDEAAAYAPTPDGAVRATHHGRPAVNLNGDAVLNTGNETGTGFVLHHDEGVIERLLATYPDTFWQSAHDSGHPAVLVRHRTARNDLVREMIAGACDHARRRKPPRARR